MIDLHPYRVLCVGSLRFDGYKYCRECAYDVGSALDVFLELRVWQGTPQEMMATVFMLQRWLCHWGGEAEPRHGLRWWALRELFLTSAHFDVPDSFRGPRWDRWQSEYEPRFEEALAAVRSEHKATQYQVR